MTELRWEEKTAPAVIAYAKEVLRIDPGRVLLAVNLAAAVEFFTIPLFGLLSDHGISWAVYGYDKAMVAGET